MSAEITRSLRVKSYNINTYGELYYDLSNSNKHNDMDSFNSLIIAYNVGLELSPCAEEFEEYIRVIIRNINLLDGEHINVVVNINKSIEYTKNIPYYYRDFLKLYDKYINQ